MQSTSINKTLIKVCGEDAKTFLQGQLSNDIETVCNNWQYSAYCNPKGQVIDVFLLWSLDGMEFFLAISEDIADSTLARLKMFILRSKVQIEVLASSFHFHRALPIEERDAFKLNKQENACVVSSVNPSHVLRLHNAYLSVNVNTQTAKQEQQAHDWLVYHIEQGIPIINQALTETYIPQLINLDALGAISFKKGCYTGQEVIARTRYLGKLKQRMFLLERAEQDSGQALSCAQSVYCDTSLEKKAGTIIASSNQHLGLLAIIRLEYLEADLYAQLGDKVIPLTLSPTQPYVLPA